MYLLRFMEYLVYLLGFAMIVWAADRLYRYNTGTKLPVYRLRFKSRLKGSDELLHLFLCNEEMDKLLHFSGRPFGIDSIRYNFVRFVAFGLWSFYISITWYVSRGSFPTDIACLILALLILTTPYKGLPLYFFLERLRQIRLRERNKECFTLYSMIQNEFYTDCEKPLNMYSVLSKMRPYFKAIDKALGKAIMLWKNSPADALDAFANEVGTEEARDLAQILKNVDQSSPQDARDIIDSRYDQFITKRHENHRRYRNNIGLVGYAAVMLSVFAVIYNTMVIFNLEKQELLKFIYRR